MKFNTKFNVFMSMLLSIILLSNAAICFCFISSLNENINNIKSATKTFFQAKTQAEIEKLERIDGEITSQVNLIELINEGKNTNTAEQINKIIHSETISNAQTMRSLVFDTNGSLLYSSSHLTGEFSEMLSSLYKIYMKKPSGTSFFFFKAPNKGFNEINICQFSEIKKMNYATASFEIYGYKCLLSSVNVDEFFYEYDLSSVASLTFYNEKSKLSISNGKITGTKIEIDSTHITGTDWFFKGYVNYNFRKNSLFGFMMILFSETILLLLIILTFVYDTRKKHMIPLKKIEQFLNNFILSQKFTPLKISATKEIEIIVEALNNMVYRNKMLSNRILLNQQKLYEQERLNKATTLYALQSQVNPHFLYNIFETIRSLAVINRVSEIESIVVNLSKLLRYNLNNNYLVTLKEEFDIIKCYMVIMDIKYKDEFEIEYDISEDIFDENILRMTFQPIIENSFNHGFSLDREKFKIKISAYKEKNQLVLNFFDNGMGCSRQELKKITRNIYKNRIRRKHIGLANLYNRMYLYYHDRFSLTFNSVENEYTKVTIKINLDK